MFFTETGVFLAGGHSNYRIPSVIVTGSGVVMAFANDRRDTLIDHAQESWLVMRRKEAGGEWEPTYVLAQLPGWSCRIESAVYDRLADQTIVFCTRIPVSINEFGDYTDEERARLEQEAARMDAEAGVKRGMFLLISSDDGLTWQERPFLCTPNSLGYVGFTHGCAPGIQLTHAPHTGRLLCPARYMTGHYTAMAGLQQHGFNNALYSDDHGKTWISSEPVQPGTGECAMAELADGSILCNSRAAYFDQKRYLATSRDGGASFGEFRTDDFLIEEKSGGCNASLLRVDRSRMKDASILPDNAESILLFANPRSEYRLNMTVCVSFDEGTSWREAKTVYAGPCAYSAMAWSDAEGLFYLLYEKGVNNPHDIGLNIAAFDAGWLLG